MSSAILLQAAGVTGFTADSFSAIVVVICDVAAAVAALTVVSVFQASFLVLVAPSA